MMGLCTSLVVTICWPFFFFISLLSMVEVPWSFVNEVTEWCKILLVFITFLLKRMLYCFEFFSMMAVKRSSSSFLSARFLGKIARSASK